MDKIPVLIILSKFRCVFGILPRSRAPNPQESLTNSEKVASSSLSSISNEENKKTAQQQLCGISYLFEALA
jgi:hypothetical protein